MCSCIASNPTRSYAAPGRGIERRRRARRLRLVVVGVSLVETATTFAPARS